MFLWWSNSNGDPEKSTTAIENTQHEIEELRHELSTATLSPPSNVSKAKYNKWIVAEDNQKVGMEGRLQINELSHRKEVARQQFKETMAERTTECRQQREAASARVREHRLKMQERGQRTKEQTDAQVAQARAMKLAWKQHGARNAKIYGETLRERVLEEKEMQLETRRHEANEYKASALARAQRFADESERTLEEKRQRVQRIRQETAPEVAAQSKEQFYLKRKETAEDVRQSIKDWKVEQMEHRSEFVEKTAMNHKRAVDTRNAMIDERVGLQQARAQDASNIRMNVKEMELHKEHMKLSDEAWKRESHDDAYVGRFVHPQQAELVASSLVEQVANTHRDELAARGSRPSSPGGGKPNWNTFFGNTHKNGFFHKLFGGW